MPSTAVLAGPRHTHTHTPASVWQAAFPPPLPGPFSELLGFKSRTSQIREAQTLKSIRTSRVHR